jgi:hypothetical protein
MKFCIELSVSHSNAIRGLAFPNPYGIYFMQSSVHVLLIRLGMADLDSAINNHRDMEGRTAVRPSVIDITDMPL